MIVVVAVLVVKSLIVNIALVIFKVVTFILKLTSLICSDSVGAENTRHRVAEGKHSIKRPSDLGHHVVSYCPVVHTANAKMICHRCCYTVDGPIFKTI